MRQFLTIIVSVTLSACAPVTDRQEIRLGTAALGGAYYPLGQGLSSLVTQHLDGVSMVPIVTRGAVENPRLVSRGDLEMALTNADLAFFAHEGEAPLLESHCVGDRDAVVDGDLPVPGLHDAIEGRGPVDLSHTGADAHLEVVKGLVAALEAVGVARPPDDGRGARVEDEVTEAAEDADPRKPQVRGGGGPPKISPVNRRRRSPSV